jgi:retron-type reverse transcriptase
MSMHADEESDEGVVPMKRSNNEGVSSAETGEGRTSPKGNGGETAAARTLRRDTASNGDAMAHSWIIRFLKHRIADKRILRLIAKWLKVGIVEDGRRARGVCGAPQGAVMTPLRKR